ncbi:MAG: hypothetical protein JWO38_1285, partial [Gemmataceae bacterium]|nr:hypothetical protein [Gemmataceae bacterium]
LGGAVELARQVNLLPTHSTDKVIRYEAHLSRQLTQTFQLLDRLQAARVGGRLRPPAAAMTPTEEWEPECVPPAVQAVDSAERTQSAPEVPAAVVVEPVQLAGREDVSTDRTQSAPEMSPIVAAEPVPPAVWGVVSAERTQFAAPSPPVVASGSLPGGPDGVIGLMR